MDEQFFNVLIAMLLTEARSLIPATISFVVIPYYAPRMLINSFFICEAFVSKSLLNAPRAAYKTDNNCKCYTDMNSGIKIISELFPFVTIFI